MVLIIGAGPTGLVLALWLTRLGIPVRLIDRSTGPAEYSRALSVVSRTLEFHAQLGFADSLVEGGLEVGAANFWVRGARKARLPLGRIGEGLTPFPFVLIFPQDAHERLLLQELAALGVEVERSTELVDFEAGRGAVRAMLRRADGEEELCEAAYLAGCDGAHSTVRETLGIDFPGGTYSQLFYVADVEARGAVLDGELHVDLDEAEILAIFPLKDGGRVRLVGSMRGGRGSAPGGREATAGGREATAGRREPTFEDVSRRAIEQLHLEIGKVNWFSTYRVHHRVAQRFREGRVFLLGDAAHIHSPVGGQGMNTGIGDAVNLAWKLAAVVQRAAPEHLLESYEVERIGFARRLVATTDRVFTIATRRGPIADRVRTRLVPRIVPLLFRIPAARRFLFRTVSQIGIRYRASPLSEGRAGGVRGGDRLPWIGMGPDGSNFAPLAALGWQVHLYGEAPESLVDVCAEIRVPLHIFEWERAMAQHGLRRGALYLARPDGYVAFADAHADAERLRGYLARQGIEPAG